MKNYIFFLLFLFSSILYCQVGFHNIKDTGIPFPPTGEKRAFANHHGIHLVLANPSDNNKIVYFKLNTNGDTISSHILGKGEYPRIVGNEDTLYIFFHDLDGDHDLIRMYISTNGGSEWNDGQDIQFWNQDHIYISNGLDIVKDAHGLHLVWSECTSANENDNYLTYYANYINNWTNLATVSENYGGFPSITSSGDTIHVVCNENPYKIINAMEAAAWSRDCAINANNSHIWLNTQYIPEYNGFAKIISDSKYIHVFFRVWGEIYHRKRPISGLSWQNTTLNELYVNFDT